MPRTFAYGKMVTMFRLAYLWPLWYKDNLMMKRCGLLAPPVQQAGSVSASDSV